MLFCADAFLSAGFVYSIFYILYSTLFFSYSAYLLVSFGTGDSVRFGWLAAGKELLSAEGGWIAAKLEK